MRMAVLTLVLVALCLYAARDWFVPVCVLVIMDAVNKHDDMPHSMFDIPGANPFNILLLASVLGYLRSRSAPRQEGEVPASASFILMGFLGVILVSGIRGIIDLDRIPNDMFYGVWRSPLDFGLEFILNPLKFLIVAFLLFEGMTSRRNLLLGLCAVFGQVGLYAVRVLRHVPPSVLLMSDNPYRNRISRECGLHANDLALVMVVGFWGLACCAVLWPYLRWWWRVAGIAGLLGSFLSLALTMSRAGYVAFVATGLLFGALRWRPLLFVFPVALTLAVVLFPSVANRMSEGFDQTTVSGEKSNDIDEISAGRMTNLWPPTINKIIHSPIFGHGRLAILRTDLFTQILVHEGTVPLHPHNAYLEMLLDSGIVGLIFTLALYVGFPLTVLLAGRPEHPVLKAATTTGICAAATLLLMSLSGQTFFPREGVFVVLCCYAIMYRAHLIHMSIVAASTPFPRGASARSPARETSSSPAGLGMSGRARTGHFRDQPGEDPV